MRQGKACNSSPRLETVRPACFCYRTRYLFISTREHLHTYVSTSPRKTGPAPPRARYVRESTSSFSLGPVGDPVALQMRNWSIDGSIDPREKLERVTQLSRSVRKRQGKIKRKQNEFLFFWLNGRFGNLHHRDPHHHHHHHHHYRDHHHYHHHHHHCCQLSPSLKKQKNGRRTRGWSNTKKKTNVNK